MTTTEQIEFASFSIVWDTANTIASSATEWGGLLIGVAPFTLFAPIAFGTTTGPGNIVRSFDGVVSVLGLGRFLPAGTYQMGTIVFTHSSPWTTTVINGNIFAGIDLFSTVGGIDITGSVSLGSATINVVPEPGTAALLGLGLIGLVLAGRRKRA